MGILGCGSKTLNHCLAPCSHCSCAPELPVLAPQLGPTIATAQMTTPELSDYHNLNLHYPTHLLLVFLYFYSLPSLAFSLSSLLNYNICTYLQHLITVHLHFRFVLDCHFEFPQQFPNINMHILFLCLMPNIGISVVQFDKLIDMHFSFKTSCNG